jgi:hypothetical protein
MGNMGMPMYLKLSAGASQQSNLATIISAFFYFIFYHIYLTRCSIAVLTCTKYKSKETDIREKEIDLAAVPLRVRPAT